MKVFLTVLVCMAAPCVACVLFEPGGRYHARDPSCVVKTLASAPAGPFVDLGIVWVDCWTGDTAACEEQLRDEVCRRGGDVVWGVGDAAPSTSKLSAHVARTRATTAPDYCTDGGDASVCPDGSVSKN
jgi:hypothetical protein